MRWLTAARADNGGLRRSATRCPLGSVVRAILSTDDLLNGADAGRLGAGGLVLAGSVWFMAPPGTYGGGGACKSRRLVEPISPVRGRSARSAGISRRASAGPLARCFPTSTQQRRQPPPAASTSESLAGEVRCKAVKFYTFKDMIVLLDLYTT